MSASTQKITLAKGLNMGLRKAMEDDPKVLIMGEDVGKLGGVFRITDGLQKDFGEDRVIDSPLAESGIVGTAVGMALRGYRPVVEIQFDGFVYPAYDQIVCQVAKMTFRSQGKSKMPMVIRIPFGGGIGAVEHHSESPEAQFAHTPGLKVVACSNPIDGYWMIQQAIACDDPVIFLEPKRQYHADKAELDESATPDPLFTSRTVRAGSDATLLAYGPTVKTALKAAEAAATEGKNIEVIDLRTLSPLDMAPVFESVRRTGRAVVVHEAHVNLGMGAELSARITEECFYSLEAPVLRVGGFDTPYPPSRIEEEWLPGPRPGPRRRRPEHGVLMSEFKLPDVGEGLTEAEIVSWKVKAGDSVEINDIIVEIETAKSIVELPSPYAGTVLALMVDEGQMVDVGTPIISIGSADEAAAAAAAPAAPQTESDPYLGMAQKAGEPQVDLSDMDLSNPAASGGGEGESLVGRNKAERGPQRRARKGSATPRHRRRRPDPAAAAGRVRARRCPDRRGRARRRAGRAGHLGGAPSGRRAGGGARARRGADARGADVRALAKPPVRKLAKDLGVDLSLLAGSGAGGVDHARRRRVGRRRWRDRQRLGARDRDAGPASYGRGAARDPRARSRACAR